MEEAWRLVGLSRAETVFRRRLAVEVVGDGRLRRESCWIRFVRGVRRGGDPVRISGPGELERPRAR